MEPDRIDLSPLDPADNLIGYERLIRRIMDGAAPELARRARDASPLALVAGWARPTLAAAAMIAAFAAGALVMNGMNDRVGPTSRESTVVDALGLPAPAADWLATGREPDEADLVVAMESRR